jgi:heme exporter protein D
MDLGPHAAFIVAAYAAMIVVLSGLVTWLLFDGWRQARALEALEARGVKRRSATAAKDGAT